MLWLWGRVLCACVCLQTSAPEQADAPKADDQKYWPPSNEHTAKWRVFTDQGGKRYSEVYSLCTRLAIRHGNVRRYEMLK